MKLSMTNRVCSFLLMSALMTTLQAEPVLNQIDKLEKRENSLVEEQKTNLRTLSTLSIVKTVNQNTVASGETIVYSLTVTNNSAQNATGIEVLEMLSTNVIHVSDDSNGAFNVNTGIWTVGSLNANTSKTLKITVKAQ